MGEEVKDSDQMDAGCKSKTLTFATKRTEERPHRRLPVVVVCNCHARLRRSAYRPLVVMRPEAEPEPADKLGTVRRFEYSGMKPRPDRRRGRCRWSPPAPAPSARSFDRSGAAGAGCRVVDDTRVESGRGDGDFYLMGIGKRKRKRQE